MFPQEMTAEFRRLAFCALGVGIIGAFTGESACMALALLVAWLAMLLSRAPRHIGMI